MKKNTMYMQTCVINEIIKQYKPSEIAAAFAEMMNRKKDVSCTIYETHDDGMIFRVKRDCIITDDMVVDIFLKTVNKLISNKGRDFTDAISDMYDFEYTKDLLTEEFFSDLLMISRSGRLVSIEMDLQ